MTSHQYIIDITQENFHSYLESSTQTPLLLDFWAPWCGPCQSLMPILERLAGEYQGKFILAKVNIDEQQQLAGQFAVRSVPTVKLIKQGEVIDEFLGAQPEAEIRALLDRHIERDSDRQLAELLGTYTVGQEGPLITQIRQLIALDPDNPRLSEQLIACLVNEKRYDEAAEHIQTLPFELRHSDKIIALTAKLDFIKRSESAPGIDVLLLSIEQNPKDCQARHQLSALYILQGEYEPALQQLLEIIRYDRHFADDAGRKDMLKVFEILGNDHPLVSEYRHKMARVLY